MASNRSLGSLTLDLIAKIGGFNTSFDQAASHADKKLTEIEKRAYEFGEKIGDVFKTAAAAIGIGFTVDKFVESLKESINTMDDLSKAAQRVGTSTESFSGLSYAASLADVSIEDLQATLGKLTKSQAAALDANSKQAKIFDALGISVKNADGTLRDSTDVIRDFADRFEELHGSPEAIAAGFQIFGKSFQGIIPLLKDGSAGINEAVEEASQLNQVIGTETGEAAEAFNDNLTRLQAAVHGVFNEVASNLLPVLEDWTNQLVDTAKAGNNVKDTGDQVTQVIESLSVVVAAAAIVWDTFRGAIQAAANMAAGSLDTFQGIGKVIAHTVTFGQVGPTYKDAFNQIKNAGDATAHGIADAFEQSANDISEHAQTIKKVLNGTLLQGVFPQRKAQGQVDTFIDSIFGDDKEADAKAKAMSARLQGVLGNADANAEKAKKQADALADAYAKLFEAGQKVSEDADPTAKAYNTYAQTVRNIAKLGGDVIEKGGDVVQVQNAVEQAVTAAQKKLADDLAAPMKAAAAYNDSLQEQLQATKDLIDSKVDAIGIGSKEAANQQELARVYQQGTKAISDFQKQRELHPNAMTDEQYNSELAGLKKYWSDVYDVTKDGQDRIDEKNADWTNGVATALQNFYDQQANQAQIAGQLTDDFLSGASDAFADFINGSKSAGDAFKDFINTFEQQITQAISKNLLSQLFQINGNGSGGGSNSAWGSIFDLFSNGSFFGYANGGTAAPNSISRVNERGTELLSVGGNDYLMMGSEAGRITPAEQVRGGGVTQNNQFIFAAPTSSRTQTQVANKSAYELRRAQRLGA
jgi:lambda family phage tail tape measure protein